MAKKEVDWRRRKYPRIKESCEVRYRVIQDQAMPPPKQGGVAVNISGGGMCFSVERPLKPGSMVVLEMSIDELTTPVVSLGRVVWCEPAAKPGKFDVGVEFWWIGWADEKAQEQMLKYVSQKLDKVDADNPG